MVPGYLKLATVLVLSILRSSIAFIETSCEHNQFCDRRTDRLLRRFDDSERYSRLGDRHRYVDRLEFEDRHHEFSNLNHNDKLRDQSNRFDIEKVWREERRSNRDNGDQIHRDSFNVKRDSRLIRKREDPVRNDRALGINRFPEQNQGSNTEKLERSIGRESIRIQSAKQASIRAARDERRVVENFREINKFERSESVESKTERSVQQNRRVKENLRRVGRREAANSDRLNMETNRRRTIPENLSRKDRIQIRENEENRVIYTTPRRSIEERFRRAKRSAFREDENNERSDMNANRRHTDPEDRIYREDRSRQARTEIRENEEKRIISTTARRSIQERFRRVERSAAREDENTERSDMKTNRRRTDPEDRRHREDRSRQFRTQIRENEENRIISTTPPRSIKESLRRVGRLEDGNTDRLNMETIRRGTSPDNRSRQERIEIRENGENLIISTIPCTSIEERFPRVERSAAREDKNTERSDMKTNHRRTDPEDRRHREDQSRRIRTQIRENEENRIISTTPPRSIEESLRRVGRREESALREDGNTDRLNMETIRRRTSPYNRSRRENEENRIISTIPRTSIEERFRRVERSAPRKDEKTELSYMKTNRRRTDPEDRRHREDRSRQIRSQIREKEENRIISTTPSRSIEESLRRVGRREESALREDGNTDRLNMKTNRRRTDLEDRRHREDRSRQIRTQIRENEENLIISTIPRTSIEGRFQRVERSAVRENENTDRLDVKTVRRRTDPEDRRYREDRSRQIRSQIRENEENRIFSTAARSSNERSLRRVGRHEKLTVRDDFRRVERNEESAIRNDGNTDRLNIKTSRHRTDPEDRRLRQVRLQQDRIESQKQSKLRQNSRTKRNGEERRDHLIVEEVGRVTERTDSKRNEQAMRIQRQQSREFRSNFARNIQENSDDLKLDKRFVREYASTMVDNRPQSFQINENAISYTKTPNDFSSLYQILQAIIFGGIFLNMLKRQKIPGKEMKTNWAFEKFAILEQHVQIF